LHIVDPSLAAPMLARVAKWLPPGAPVTFVRADATYQFEFAAFDLLFSRLCAIFSPTSR
jgi:hypothetical protein